MNHAVPSFFRIRNVGAAHCEWLTFLRTPSSHSHSTSCLRVSRWHLGTGKALAWQGVASLFNFSFARDPFHLPSVLLKRSSCLISSLHEDSFSPSARVGCCSWQISSRSAALHLASRTMHFTCSAASTTVCRCLGRSVHPWLWGVSILERHAGCPPFDSVVRETNVHA